MPDKQGKRTDSERVPRQRSAGIDPIRKIRVAFSGLRFAVLHDFAVTCKVALSTLVMAVCYYQCQWLDFGRVFVVTGFMLVAEMGNTTIEA
jgi:diacylglycerol kinase (ATP)